MRIGKKACRDAHKLHFQELYSQHFIFFSMNGPNKLVLHYTRLEMLASLLGPFVSYDENEVL
jgi:hypothetical protein